MREMKDSGIEWIGEIPKDWKLEKIKYVADFEPFCDFSNISKEDKISYVPMECIKQGYFQPKIAKYGELPNSLTRFQDNDIAMAKVTPCFENGNIAIMSNLKSKVGLGSSELFVFRAKKVITKYLFYWLQNKDFIEIACSTMTGVGGLKRVSSYFCKNCKMHIPSIEEQNRIADYLDKKCSKIDEIISKQQTIIEKLKEYKLSIITEAVIKGLNPDVTMKDSGVEWIGEIPEHWEITKIKHKAILNPKCDFSNISYDTLITYTPMECIKNGYYNNRTEILSKIPSSLTPFEEGDIVMAKVTPCFENGNIAIMNNLQSKVGLGSSELFVFRSKGILTKYLFYFLQNINFTRQACLTMTGAGGLKRVSSEFCKNCKLPLPSYVEQKQITDYLDSKCEKIDFTINKKQKLIDKLTEYKKSLIYEVVTGKKEV